MTAPAFREGKVALQNEHGEIGLVDPSNVNELLTAGYRPVDEQTASRAITAPIDWTARKLGAQTSINNLGQTPEEAARTNQAVAEMQQTNPGSAFVGEVGVQLAALAATGITSAAGSLGARAAAATGAQAAKLGGLVARGAAIGAVEGGALGVMQATEDPEASAGHVLAAGGMGALLGAGTGSVFAGAGRGLSRVFGRAATEGGTDLAQRAELDTVLKEAAAAPANSGRAASTYNDLTSRLIGVDKDLLEDVGPFGRRAAEAEHTAHNLPRIIDDAALEMRPELNEAQKAVRDVTRIFQQRDLTANQIEKIGGRAFNTPERRTAASLMIGDAADSLEQNLEMAPTDLLGGSVRKKVEVLQREFGNLAKSASDSESAAESLTMARQAKRTLARTIDDWGTDMKRLADAGRLTSEDARQLQTAQQMLMQTHDSLRTGLRDSSLWGKAVASAQAEVDDVFHEGGVSALRRFEKTFMVDSGQNVWGQGIRETEADPGKIAQVLRQLGTPDKFLAEGALTDYTKMAKKLVSTIGEKYGLEGAEAETVQRAVSRLESVESRMGAVRDQMELAGKWETLAKKSGEHAGLLGHAPVIGTLLGGPVGLVAGMLAKAVTNPAVLAGARNATEDAAEKLGLKLTGFGRWVASGANTASKGVERIGGATTIGTLAALSVYRGKHKTDADAYEERTKTVLAADMTKLGPHLDGQPPDVQ